MEILIIDLTSILRGCKKTCPLAQRDAGLISMLDCVHLRKNCASRRRTYSNSINIAIACSNPDVFRGPWCDSHGLS